MTHEWAHCCDEAANHQLLIAAAFWIIWIVFTEECSSLTQNLMQIHCSTHSAILNVTATQHTCSLNGICCPLWLAQWSHHYSHMRIPVHSPWLPGYINVAQTILVILTMAGLFPDRPCRMEKYNWNYIFFKIQKKYLFLKFTYFRERGWETKRERQKLQFVVWLIYTFIGCFLYVPWPGSEPTALVDWDNVLTRGATQPGLKLYLNR